MQTNRILALALVLALPFCLTGQEFSGGFKVGLNFSRFEGPSAMDGQGNNLESNDYATGFHVGAIINYRITDLFGVRAELQYSQKGSEYIFDGPSYLRLFTQEADPVISFGNRREVITFSNSYIDVPLMAYLRFGRIEVSAGANAAFMVGSSGQGELTFSGISQGGQNVDPIIMTIDGNYLRDEAIPRGFGSITTRRIDNRDVAVPEIINAYYDGNMVDEILFNRFDLGLNGGVSIYINNGLNLGFRINYGLTDLTRMEQDVDLAELNNGNLILNDDQDRNVSLQASVGFSF